MLGLGLQGKVSEHCFLKRSVRNVRNDLYAARGLEVAVRGLFSARREEAVRVSH